jgi:hypothetical protein
VYAPRNSIGGLTTLAIIVLLTASAVSLAVANEPQSADMTLLEQPHAGFDSATSDGGVEGARRVAIDIVPCRPFERLGGRPERHAVIPVRIRPAKTHLNGEPL